MLDKHFKLGYNFAATGCGAARLARAVRVGEVVGSNPTIPTEKTAGINQRFFSILAGQAELRAAVWCCYYPCLGQIAVDS